MKKIHELWKYLFVGLFFILDRVLKHIAGPDNTTLFAGDLLGFEYFENIGIAFGIPIPVWLVIISTPILLILLLVLIDRSKQSKSLYLWFVLIFVGSVSNLFDRMVYGFVIDYFRIVTAIINIADIMILVGMVQLFFSIHKRRS